MLVRRIGARDRLCNVKVRVRTRNVGAPCWCAMIKYRTIFAMLVRRVRSLDSAMLVRHVKSLGSGNAKT